LEDTTTPITRRNLTLEDYDAAGASELADWRAASTGLQLADFECEHGLIGACPECDSDR
jgi:hypothetical protein